MQGKPADPPGDVLAALQARVADLSPGDPVDLQDLQQSDRLGPDSFAALASRFGLIGDGSSSWHMTRQPSWAPGWVGPEHEDQCLDLFESAFRYRMDPRLWRWKYRDAAPFGAGAWQEGRLVGFYGGMPRDVLVRGAPASAVQIGDVMVEPSQRGVMTRSGPFQIAAATFLERRIGHGRPHLLGFGFPTVKALLVAKRLGLYEEVDQMTQLTWTSRAAWNDRLGLRLSPLAADSGDAIDLLWQRMAGDFQESILGVRDWRYVQARYLGHPTVHYHCLLVKGWPGSTPRVAIVLRRLEDQQVELVDVIGPLASFGMAVAAARHWAQKHGAVSVRAWVTTSHAHALDVHAPKCTPLDLAVPTSVWSAGPGPDEVRGRWWLMAGDSDFR